MSKFNTTQQKLRKLWEKVQKNKSDLANNDNTDQLAFFQTLSQQSTFKNIIELYDSGFFSANPIPLLDPSFVTLDENNNLLVTTVNKNTKVPIAYRYTKKLDLNIPEDLLPYLKVVPEVKPLPNYNLALTGLFTASQFGLDNDIITIKGDNSIVYQGKPFNINSSIFLTNTLLSQFTEEDRINNKIPLSNTKKVWKATIEYTNNTTNKKFKVIGIVTRLTTKFDIGIGCNSNTEQDIYECFSFFEGGTSGNFPERHDNEILNLTSTSFSIKAKEIQSRWVNIPPCQNINTINHGIIKSASFSSSSVYAFRILGTHENLTDELFLGNNQSVVIDTAFVTINSQTFEEIGVRAYYSNNTWGVLSIKETGNTDGNFLDEFELDSTFLPNTSNSLYDDPPATLPYTSITFQRNFDTFNREIFETDKYIQHTRQPIKTYLRKNNNTFFIHLSGTFLLITPATRIDINSRQFPKYNDIYTIVDTSYDNTTFDHSFADTPIYTSEIIDVQVRIRIFLQNPLYWREEKTYDI